MAYKEYGFFDWAHLPQGKRTPSADTLVSRMGLFEYRFLYKSFYPKKIRKKIK